MIVLIFQFIRQMYLYFCIYGTLFSITLTRFGIVFYHDILYFSPKFNHQLIGVDHGEKKLY